MRNSQIIRLATIYHKKTAGDVININRMPADRCYVFDNDKNDTCNRLATKNYHGMGLCPKHFAERQEEQKRMRERDRAIATMSPKIIPTECPMCGSVMKTTNGLIFKCPNINKLDLKCVNMEFADIPWSEFRQALEDNHSQMHIAAYNTNLGLISLPVDKARMIEARMKKADGNHIKIVAPIIDV